MKFLQIILSVFVSFILLFSCDNPLIDDTDVLSAPLLRGQTPTNNVSPAWFWTVSEEAESFSYRISGNAEWITVKPEDAKKTQFQNWADYYNSNSPGPVCYLTDEQIYVYTWQGTLLDRDEQILFLKANFNNKGEVESSRVVQKTIVVDLDPPQAARFSAEMVGLTDAPRPSWNWDSSIETSFYMVSFNSGPSFRVDYTISEDTRLPQGSFIPDNALPEGIHRLSVYVFDEAGNQSDPVYFDKKVDFQLEMVPEFDYIQNPTPNNQPLISWSVPSGAAMFRYQLQFSGTDLKDEDWIEQDSGVSPGYRLPPQTDGDYIFYLQAYGSDNGVDKWFQITSLELTIDSTALLPPEVSVGSFGSPVSISSDLTPTWIWQVRATAGGPLVEPTAYRFQLNSEYEGGWNSEVGGTVESFTPDSNLFSGNNILYVQAKSERGLWSESGSFTIFLETTAPSVNVFSPGYNNTPMDHDTEFQVFFSEPMSDFSELSDTTGLSVEYSSFPDFPVGSTSIIDISDHNNIWNSPVSLTVQPPDNAETGYPSWPQNQFVRITLNGGIKDLAGNSLIANDLVVKEFFCAVELTQTGLDSNVISKINSSGITIDYAHQVQFLSYPYPGAPLQLSDLTGFEYLTNLQYLELKGHNFSDISALAGMDDLRVLSLSGNPLNTDSHLTISRFTKLETLKLDNTGQSNFSYLSTMTGLKSLDINNNAAAGTLDVSSLVYLTDLNAGNNALTAISGLSTSMSLRTLYCNDNNLENLPGLSGLMQLSYINSCNNMLTELPDLSTLDALETLILSGNNISSADNFDGADGLDSLIRLDMSGNSLTSVPAWGNLISLEDLSLADNTLGNIDNLTGLATLKNLDLSAQLPSSIGNIPDLSSLSVLETLNLAGGGVSDWNNIVTIPSLAELDISDNPVNSVPDLSGMTNLLFIKAGNTDISDVTGFRTAANLVELWLDNSVYALRNIENLGTLQYIEKIVFSDSSIFIPDIWTSENDQYNNLEGDLTSNSQIGFLGADIVYRSYETAPAE